MINEKFIECTNLDDDISMLIGFRENGMYRLSDMLKRLDDYRSGDYRDLADRVLWDIEEECRYIVSLTKDIDDLVRYGQSKGE